MILLFACAPEPAPTTVVTGFVVEVAPTPGLVAMSGPLLLRRMSLDLRGVLPSVEELDAIEADPSKIEVYRDMFLDDPRLEERLVRLFAESWHTRVDEMPLYVSDYGLTDLDIYRFQRAIGEEPLRLMARVAVEDRPWSDIVTADHTIANDLLIEMFGLDAEPGEGWRQARYTDLRPAAGVLGTNGLWWRFTTNPFNHSRARAAAITRLLLCDDYLARPVTFVASPALLDVDGSALATQTDPACLACHATLDPIAQVLFGFWPFDMYEPLEMERYHPEREPLGEEFLGVDAAYFGTPMDGLGDLGPLLAADPRFPRCAVETLARALWRRDVELADFDQVEVLRRSFVADGERLRPLVRALTDTAEYRAGAFEDVAAEDTMDRTMVRRTLSTDQLATSIADLTGWTWTYAGYEQLDNDTVGFRVMTGGVDGIAATRPTADPSVSWTLSTATAAEGAALAAASALGSGALSGVTEATIPGDAAFGEALRDLHWRLFGVRADDAWEADMTDLWSSVAATDGARVGWAAVLTSMLRDPAFLTY